jgi:predicted nucleic acid-binding protein
MTTDLLFDTGTLIDIYKGRERIRAYFDTLLAGELNAYLSVISEAELWRGLRAGEEQRHDALISHFTTLPLHSRSARLAGRWMQSYLNDGLGWMDALITATAVEANATVLTRDKRLVRVLQNHAAFLHYE